MKDMAANKPEIVAFHLPQFHCIPENDEWWGKGFTEWVNVKKAIPLFNNHNQPRVPKNKYYYDLSDNDSIIWEMELAKQYGISAFCYYHYWFGGKLLLQKPLEMMRNIQNRIDYFFCWANEPWSRTWTDNAKSILIDQSYGGIEEWEKHINYLMPFFLDEHYKKIEGKPIFVLYRAESIPNCEEMIAYFNDVCTKNGLNGIYVIEERNSFQKEKYCRNSNAIIDFEPMYTISHGRSYFQRLFDKLNTMLFNKKTGNAMLVFDYDHLWKTIIKRQYRDGVKHYLGGFVDWDNTPRKSRKGTVVMGYSPDKFKKHLKKQVEHCQLVGSEILFINAWNEWGEGTYLEPDEKYGLTNLEIIQDVIGLHE